MIAVRAVASVIQVSYKLLETPLQPAVRLANYALLSDDERERHARFVFEPDRDAYLMAHVLLRKALSCHANVSPENWRFHKSAEGRPEIAEPNIVPRLRFNISHTRQLVACVVAAEHDVGIDVEYVRGGPFVERVANRHFSPRERDALSQVRARNRVGLFFDYWTLKEAYVKACGLGLALQLDEFWFRLSATAPPAICFAGDQDAAKAWRFALRRPTPDFRLAVAARLEPGKCAHFDFAHDVRADPLKSDG
jgi:4'-phosphopantetheinyl transferase